MSTSFASRLLAPVPVPSRCVAAQAKGPAQEAKKSLKPRVKDIRSKVGQSKNVSDVMTPDGPGPELINGRLAMIGFFSVICVELYSNKTLFQQVREAPVAILAVVAAITVASLIPLVRPTSIKDDGSGEGPSPGGGFNFTNEIINGRAAMIGIALVIAYEAYSGFPLFQS